MWRGGHGAAAQGRCRQGLPALGDAGSAALPGSSPATGFSHGLVRELLI